MDLKPNREQSGQPDGQERRGAAKIERVMRKEPTEIGGKKIAGPADMVRIYAKTLEGQNTNFLGGEQNKINKELGNTDKQLQRLAKEIFLAFGSGNKKDWEEKTDEAITKLLEKKYEENEGSSVDVTVAIEPLMEERKQLLDRKWVLENILVKINDRLEEEGSFDLNTLSKKQAGREKGLRERAEEAGRQMAALWDNAIIHRQELDGMKLGFLKSLKFDGKAPATPDAHNITLGLMIATNLDLHKLADKGKTTEVRAIKNYMENLYRLEAAAQKYLDLEAREEAEQLGALDKTIKQQNALADKAAWEATKFTSADQAWFEEGESTEALEAKEWEALRQILEDEEYQKTLNAKEKKEIEEAKKENPRFQGELKLTKAQQKILADYKKSPSYHLAQSALEDKALKMVKKQAEAPAGTSPTLFQTLRKWGIRTAAGLGLLTLSQIGGEPTLTSPAPTGTTQPHRASDKEWDYSSLKTNENKPVEKVEQINIAPEEGMTITGERKTKPIQKTAMKKETAPSTTLPDRTKIITTARTPGLSFGSKSEMPMPDVSAKTRETREESATKLRTGAYEHASNVGPESRIFDDKTKQHYLAQDILSGGKLITKITNEKTGEVKYRPTQATKAKKRAKPSPEISFTPYEVEEDEALASQIGNIKLPAKTLGTTPETASKKGVDLKPKLTELSGIGRYDYKTPGSLAKDIEKAADITSTLVTKFSIPRKYAGTIEQALSYARTMKDGTMRSGKRVQWQKTIRALEKLQQSADR